MNLSVTIEREFERESHRIDQLIWDALGLRSGESALFCGFANNREWIKRAVDIDVAVSVISDDAEAMRELDGGPVTVVRGSTAMLPARDGAYDATIAFHYLHEIDPFFHANVVSELARVGKRCVIVEPAPPSDPLGLRIASLYSRAKREFGQFETYHHMDYWRKLLAIVKPDVSCQTFTFLRTPPPQAVRDTVALIIATMAAEQTPDSYISELRALAARPDAKLLPQARCVIVGTSTGQTISVSAGTPFRTKPLEETRPAVAVKPFVPPSLTRTSTAGPTHIAPPGSTVYTSATTEPEFPAVIPPAAPGTRPPPAASQIARNAFGLTPAAQNEPARLPASAFAPPEDATDPFGVSAAAEGVVPADFGWAWEPPDAAPGNGS